MRIAAAEGFEVETLEQALISQSATEPEVTPQRAFEDLEPILHSLAASPTNYRNFAAAYTRCRDALLRPQTRSALPGFMIQCQTSEKFRDFISLYDGSVAARQAFISQALGRFRASLGWTRSYDVFDDEDF